MVGARDDVADDADNDNDDDAVVVTDDSDDDDAANDDDGIDDPRDDTIALSCICFESFRLVNGFLGKRA